MAAALAERRNAVRDWDSKTGFPTKKKLEELQLGWTIDDVW
jgi:hypothetical protein